MQLLINNNFGFLFLLVRDIQHGPLLSLDAQTVVNRLIELLFFSNSLFFEIITFCLLPECSGYMLSGVSATRNIFFYRGPLVRRGRRGTEEEEGSNLSS